jgi:hypothetical protein
MHPGADRLQDYLDDLLCREDRAELEAHLAGCRDCTAEVLGERELRRALADLPRAITPERDLLAGINAAIDAAEGDVAFARAPDVQPLRARAPRRSFGDRSISSVRFALAAAALVLIALTATITMLLTREPGTRPLARGDAPATDPVVREVLAAEQSYVAAGDELELALASARSQLDPATVRLVEANLRVIDAALAEARAALRGEPDNAALARLLQAAHEQKLALLRRATRAGT